MAARKKAVPEPAWMAEGRALAQEAARVRIAVTTREVTRMLAGMGSRRVVIVK